MFADTFLRLSGQGSPNHLLGNPFLTSMYRSQHMCLLDVNCHPSAEQLVQLEGRKLSKFLDGIMYSSPLQKVMLLNVLIRYQ